MEASTTSTFAFWGMSFRATIAVSMKLPSARVDAIGCGEGEVSSENILRSAEEGFSGGTTLICRTSSSLLWMLWPEGTGAGCVGLVGGEQSRALLPSRPEALVGVGDLFFCVVTRLGGKDAW